jgi:hypothetical protein
MGRRSTTLAGMVLRTLSRSSWRAGGSLAVRIRHLVARQPAASAATRAPVVERNHLREPYMTT